MDVKQAIYTRHAARSFTPEGVAEETLREFVDVAVQAVTRLRV